jgi:NrS-1  polymerase HBD domain
MTRLAALEELSNHRRWVLWKLEHRKGTPTKPPYQPSGVLADTADPDTWSSEPAVRAASGRFDGVGFVISGSDFAGVDLDHCLSFPPEADGRPVVDPWAAEIVQHLDSYTEITPSGESLRVWVRGQVPAGRQRSKLGPAGRGRLEIYSGANPARYFTVTGEHLDGTPAAIHDRQAPLLAVFRQYFETPDHATTETTGTSRDLSDAEDRALIARAQADHGDRFKKLWAGDPSSYGSISEGDFALVAWLSFYSQDPVQLERLMRASGLARDKWDTHRGTETFLAYTIRRQLAKDRARAEQAQRAQDRARAEQETAPPSEPATPTERPTIGLRAGALGWATSTAWEVLAARNEPPVLFRSTGYPVRLDLDASQAPIVRRLTLPMLRDALADRIDFQRSLANGTVVNVDPPRDLCETMLTWAGDRLSLPVLDGVVECPVMLRSGEILDRPGYSPTATLYYAPAPDLVVPSEPRSLDAAHALLEELVQDFPFAAPRDRTHAIGLALALVGRDVIEGQAPLHLVDAPTPGTGKGLLLDALCWPAVGRQLGRMTRSSNEEEERKRLTAALLGQPSALFLDNLSGRLEGDALSSVLTTGVWEDRLLGAHQIIRIPCRTLFLATANNLATNEELARRLVQIRLDAGVEQPALRPASDFRHPDLLGWCRAHRGALVRALLTLWSTWFAAGCPRFTTTRLGSFESWAETIGGVLQHAGFAGFLDNRTTQTDTVDPVIAEWRVFVDAWWTAHESGRVHVRELWAILTRDTRPHPLPHDPPELRHLEFVFDLDLRGGDLATLKKRLGRRLQEFRDRLFGDYRVRLGGTSYKGREYYLEKSK